MKLIQILNMPEILSHFMWMFFSAIVCSYSSNKEASNIMFDNLFGDNK